MGPNDVGAQNTRLKGITRDDLLQGAEVCGKLGR